jgi:hypothetical protein
MGGGLKKKQKKLDAIAKGKPATKRKHEEPDDGKAQGTLMRKHEYHRVVYVVCCGTQYNMACILYYVPKTLMRAPGPLVHLAELEEDDAQDAQVTARRRSGTAEGEERPSKRVLKRRGEQARAKSKLASSATPRAATTANPFAEEFKKVVPAQLEEKLKKLLKARGVQPTHEERRMKEAIKAELTAQREGKNEVK